MPKQKTTQLEPPPHTLNRSDGSTAATSSPYVSPKELAARWRCSRSQVDRIARRAGFTKLALGTGRNGIVRYLRSDVEALEASRLLRM